MLKQKFIKAFEKIGMSQKVLLVTHASPDGDAVSSVCALGEFLNSEKKDYLIYCEDKPQQQFSFLPNWEKITSDRDKMNFAHYDLIIVLDCGSLKRTGLTAEISGRGRNQFVVDIDHHPKIDDFADLEIRNSESAATVEILYNFFKTNRIRINRGMADCILAGLMTDTGNFIYPSTSEKTVRIASEMLLYGARFTQISGRAWRNKSIPAMKLWGEAIDNLKINKKYNFAYTVLQEKDAGNIDDDELEGISGFLSALGGVSGFMLLREVSGGCLKGSLRSSKKGADMSLLASFLGGGGHKKASGFRIEGGLKEGNGRWTII